MTEEDLPIQLPQIPEVPFSYLTTGVLPVGQRLVHYIESVLRAKVPDDYRVNCERLDEIREQLRNQHGLQDEQLHLYADYVTLITGLTQDFDISESGAKVQFQWEKTKLNLVDFDVCCMGYNVVVGLLKIASRISLNSDSNLRTMINAINPARAICNKILELHREDFSSAVAHDKIIALSGFLEAFWVHATICMSIFAHKNALLVAKLAKLLSTLYAKTSPAMNDLALYFNVLASIKMSENSMANKEYGIAIAYGNQAISLVPQPANKKAKQSPAAAILAPLVDPFRPKLETTIDDNRRIYFEAVPSVEEVPACKAPPFAGKYKWESDFQVEPYNSTVSINVKENITKRHENFIEQIQNASADIAEARSLVPEQLENEMHQMISDLYAKRTLCREKTEAIANILGQRAQVISQRYPNAFGQFNQLRPIVDQAAQTDLFFETQYGKAKSLLQSMKDHSAILAQSQDTMNILAKQAQDAATEAIEASKSTDMTSVLKANTKFTTTFDQIAAQLNPLFVQIRNSTTAIRAEAERNVKPYQAEIQTVRGGFGQGIQCYTNLLQQLTNLQNQISNC
ncbi:hypothetical protein TRFO_39169 [Tritrichomonas foetus]|uniref:BRO1 domain-containing protein n=1 Tax=Tritrichomonas foetus TaxID=1144522 RepID=A0A1J4J7N9_9EUKA|nr:hypothetical protein TRFO_39169 [Tritrichomonas foetus]|eukprot:OHS94673.1 hypothetical protein TRFO_39169 [Tritrichomonas foetus]